MINDPSLNCTRRAFAAGMMGSFALLGASNATSAAVIQAPSSLANSPSQERTMTMKIQTILSPKPGTGRRDFEPHIVAEERAVWASYEAGILREMYFQPEPMTVVLVFEANSHDAVTQELARYPMVAADLFNVQLITLGHWAPIKALFRDNALATPTS
jgi:hypothetical protein